MPIDVCKYHRLELNALAKRTGLEESYIEPKSMKYGTEYSFPANMHYELEEGGVRMYEKYTAYMTEKYEETITQAIAAEAKKEGCTKAVILDKWKIVKALAAANPDEFPDWEKVRHGQWLEVVEERPDLCCGLPARFCHYECSVCGQPMATLTKSDYCSHCGAKMDIEPEETTCQR